MTTTPTGTTAPAPPSAPPRLPAVAPYPVLDGEVEPACKRAAVSFAETALSAEGGAGEPDLAARLARIGLVPAVAGPLTGLVAPGAASTLAVVYPQYGGLTRDLRSASIMLVAEQVVLPAGGGAGDVARRSLTLDIRLSRRGSTWVVTQVVPQATPVAGATVSAAVRQVLASDRVRLPGAARLDLLSGTVDERIPQVLLTLARRWRLHVQVVRTGHPTDVFGTDRPSNHTLGRAVDLWQLDDVPVVEHGRAPWPDVMRAAAKAGADEIGGPRDLNAPAGRPYFSDHVHQDHVHVGFEDPLPEP